MRNTPKNTEKSIRFIGCCCAYCKTCKPYRQGFCKGCKLGYDDGARDINKAKCKIKVCCFKERKLETCADCPDYPDCKTILSFQDKSGYKYKKYKQSTDYIIKNGYAKFVKLADNWNNPYGKLD
jgi:hypothetical protein